MTRNAWLGPKDPKEKPNAYAKALIGKKAILSGYIPQKLMALIMDDGFEAHESTELTFKFGDSCIYPHIYHQTFSSVQGSPDRKLLGMKLRARLDARRRNETKHPDGIGIAPTHPACTIAQGNLVWDIGAVKTMDRQGSSLKHRRWLHLPSRHHDNRRLWYSD
jgi:hypothetical protein